MNGCTDSRFEGSIKRANEGSPLSIGAERTLVSETLTYTYGACFPLARLHHYRYYHNIYPFLPALLCARQYHQSPRPAWTCPKLTTGSHLPLHAVLNLNPPRAIPRHPTCRVDRPIRLLGQSFHQPPSRGGRSLYPTVVPAKIRPASPLAIRQTVSTETQVETIPLPHLLMWMRSMTSLIC